MEINERIKYIGVEDRTTDLFEGQYPVPDGITYNSYFIDGEKTAVMDTVAEGFEEIWLENLKKASGGRAPDYLIVQHMEPDHSSGITALMETFPETVIVSNAKSFPMMKQFFGEDYPDRRIAVGDGDSLDLGSCRLEFITAPMVHWPEVTLAYDSTDGVLFSADAFGRFGISEQDGEWDGEAARYYFGIVGKFGSQVKKLLDRVAGLNVTAICPLHGPVLKKDIGHYTGLYGKWASYQPENDGIFIAYTSVYGNTKKAAELLGKSLEEKGRMVISADLSRCDMSQAVSNAFRCGTLVLATTTYNGDIFPPMREFISALKERGFRNRRAAFVENGTWAPRSAKVMEEMLSGCPGMEFARTKVTLMSALTDASEAAAEALAQELCGAPGDEN